MTEGHRLEFMSKVLLFGQRPASALLKKMNLPIIFIPFVCEIISKWSLFLVRLLRFACFRPNVWLIFPFYLFGFSKANPTQNPNTLNNLETCHEKGH